MSNEIATAEKKALLEAFDTVLKTQAEEREAQRVAEAARRRARNRSRPVMWLCAILILFTGLYLWIEQPEWVFPTRPLPESVVMKEASLRIAMANAAQHVERFRKRHGRLPSTLPEAGAHAEGYRFEPNGTVWRLTGQNGPVRLTLTSEEPLSQFLGNSFEVISRRVQ